jgi:5'-3' exonuclease
MEGQKEKFSFEEKIESETQKRNNYIAEANDIIESIKQHCEEKKKELKSIDVERNAIINQIHDAVNQKDSSQLDSLFERLR